MALITPSAKLLGVVEDFAVKTRPSSVIATASVNVPPISMANLMLCAYRYLLLLSCTSSHQYFVKFE